MALKASDHTKIVELAIEAMFEDRLKPGPRVLVAHMGALNLFNQLNQRADNTEGQRRLLGEAEVAIKDTRDALAKVDPTNKTWKSAVPIVARIVAFDGDAKALAVMLRDEMKVAPAELQTGLKFAVDILDDGAATIYNEDFWVAHQASDPHVIIGQADTLWGRIKERVREIIKDDAVGAVAGGAGGAVVGGPVGGAEGAAAGAVANSVQSALGG